jgi:hypothetical protein
MCQVFKQKSEKDFHKENLKSLVSTNPEIRLFFKNIENYDLKKSQMEQFHKFCSEKKELEKEAKSWKSKYFKLLKSVKQITKSLTSYNSKKSSNG